jgi:hypothetical protein
VSISLVLVRVDVEDGETVLHAAQRPRNTTSVELIVKPWRCGAGTRTELASAYTSTIRPQRSHTR